MNRRAEQLKNLVTGRLLKSSHAEATRSVAGRLGPKDVERAQERVKASILELWTFEGDEPTEQHDATLNTVLADTRNVLHQIIATPDAALSADQTNALESVILFNGSRPSILMRDDDVPLDHPHAGEFADDFVRHRDAIKRVSQATGRIQPDRGGPGDFFGTGVLISASDRLVLTNRHVAHKIRRRTSTISKYTGDSIEVYSGVTIDFAGETRSGRKRVFKVVEMWPIDTVPRGYAQLDMAVLRLGEPIAAATLPEPMLIRPDHDAELGALGTTFAVGFPGRPPEYSGATGPLYEAAVEHAFGNRFGLKRIAVGKVTRRRGEVPKDPYDWLFGHDMSTLGGSSGSAVCSLDSTGFCFGLHVAGANLKDTARFNVAHGFTSPQVRQALEQMGFTLPQAHL
ncbi:MAG: serine protease [Myxococcota bacterium]